MVPSGGVYTNVPSTSAVAFSCVLSIAVPKSIAAGSLQSITGSALNTLMNTVALFGSKAPRSLGVNVAVSSCVCPASKTVPIAGLYSKVPSMFAVAFNCVALSSVPNTMSSGLSQVIRYSPTDSVEPMSIWLPEIRGKPSPR